MPDTELWPRSLASDGPVGSGDLDLAHVDCIVIAVCMVEKISRKVSKSCF